MSGFETTVLAALKQHLPDADFVSESENAELKITPGKRIPAGYAEMHYEQKLGRKNESVLTLLDSSTGKTIERFEFLMPSDAVAKQEAAEEFAMRVGRKLAR